jgi:ubiquitin-conjugating enzyme (huntingtin interacting protein 2)
MNKTTRVTKEYNDLVNNKSHEFIVTQVNGNLFHWKAVIKGAPDTVYQGGKFQIDIVIPDEYPYQPPKMKFDTKIWHPNVSSVTGAICLDILKSEWSPALSIRTALLSIQALMCCPEPKNPQDAVVAQMYLNQIDEFNATAKKWVQSYANPEALEASKIQKLTDMGFTPAQARVNL